MGEPVQHYLMQMESIQRAVNREFFLGLFEYEAHFACYEKGAFYKKHLDAFKEKCHKTFNDSVISLMMNGHHKTVES